MEAKKTEVRCKACGMTLETANAGNTECQETNSYEHDFPGYRLRVLTGDEEIAIS